MLTRTCMHTLYTYIDATAVIGDWQMTDDDDNILCIMLISVSVVQDY